MSFQVLMLICEKQKIDFLNFILALKKENNAHRFSPLTSGFVLLQFEIIYQRGRQIVTCCNFNLTIPI